MRNLLELNHLRRSDWELMAHGVVGDAHGGCFCVPREGIELKVIASDGGGWDHISISLEDRCPTWDEMECVRKHFALPHEVWLQFGLPPKDHINCHPYCLHWFRPQYREVKLPPPQFVGPQGLRLVTHRRP
jgi:hypothetical protein